MCVVTHSQARYQCGSHIEPKLITRATCKVAGCKTRRVNCKTSSATAQCSLCRKKAAIWFDNSGSTHPDPLRPRGELPAAAKLAKPAIRLVIKPMAKPAPQPAVTPASKAVASTCAPEWMQEGRALIVTAGKEVLVGNDKYTDY